MSVIKSQPVIYSQDRSTNQNNVNTAQSINQIAKNPQSSSNTLSEIKLKVGINSIPHKLDRILSGFNVVNGSSTANITQTSGKQPKTFLYLKSDTAVTVDLNVY